MQPQAVRGILPRMAINAEVQKSGNETAFSTIRKFSRRVQGTGLIRTVRAARYFSRDTSKTVRKKRALKLLKRREDYRRQIKEGKIAELPARRGAANRPAAFSYPPAQTSKNPKVPEPQAPARQIEGIPPTR